MTTTTFQFNAGDYAPCDEDASNSFEAYCFACGRKLGKKPFHFEVNNSWELIIPGTDEAESQGCFPIGVECAKKFSPDLLVKFK